MLKETYQREMNRVALGEPRLERLLDVMEHTRQYKHRPLRTVVTVAAACAVLMTTVAAAYLLGAFDFLKKQSSYAAMGQSEVYEQYAYEVGASAATEDGDIFTVERVAMDGKVCTVFYSIRFRDPVASKEEIKALQGENAPYLSRLDTWCWSTSFALYAGGEDVSREGYSDSFERQQYLADANTFYGAWRFLLARPLTEGESLELETSTYQNVRPNGSSDMKEIVRIGFSAAPIRSEHVQPDISFARQLQDGKSPIEVLSLDCSPLGTFLTLREERLPNYLGLEFALRDADTGAYIPYIEVVVAHHRDPEGFSDNIYELLGDVSALKNLELIPVWWTGSTSKNRTVHLDELPVTNLENSAGGYVPTSYAVENGRLIVTMKPLGATTWMYPRLANGVTFLDADGEKLFELIQVLKIKNRADGTITIVSTPGAESFERDIDKVAQIKFRVEPYQLLEEQTVKIPLG